MSIKIFKSNEQLDGSINDILYTSVDFDEIKKEVISFCIIQFTIIKRKIQIIKYDSSHKQCHVHKYYSKDNILEKLDYPIAPETIRILKKDIKCNWTKYKQFYIKNKGFNNLEVI